MNNKRLMKKTIIYFIGNLSNKFLAFLLVPIYAIYLKPEDLGKYDYIVTIQNILIPIFLLAIWEAILKFLLFEENQKKKKEIINVATLFTITQSIILSIIIFIYAKITNIDNCYYIIGNIITYGFTTVWQYYSRALGENKLYIIASVISTAVNLISNVILICILKLGVEGLYISYIISGIINILIIEFKLKIFKYINIKKVNLNILKELIYFSAPLIINLISLWFLSSFARIIITNRLGEFQNGLYAFANKFSTIVSMFGTIIGMAFIEEAIITSKNNKLDNKFSETIERTFRLFLCLIILMIPAVTIFYKIISSTQYIESMKYVPLLLIYATIMSMSTIVGSIFQATNITKHISITTVIGAVISIVITLVFVNKYGVTSVILAQIVGSVITLILRYIIAKKYVFLNVKINMIAILIIIYIIISIISMKNGIIANIILEVIMLAVLLIVNKNDIIIILKKIKGIGSNDEKIKRIN